jgi:hypothetical protein
MRGTKMNKMKKRSVGFASASALAIGLSLLAVVPANAAEVPFGATSCAQGSVYTRGDTTLTPTHFVKQGGQTFPRVFTSSGSNYKVNTFYSGKYATSSAGVQTPGAIRSASQGCAD